MTWHGSENAKLSAKWYVQNDEQAMIADQLSRTVHFDENCLFILSKVTNINTKHNCKQWKLMHKQQIRIWTGRYTSTDYRHTKLFKELFS